MTSLLKLRVVTGLTVCLLCFSFIAAQAQQDPTRTGEQPTPSGAVVTPANAGSTVKGDTMPPRSTTEPQTRPRTGVKNDSTPPKSTGTRRDSMRTGGTAAMPSISDWPESSKMAAQAMIQKYGQPQESTPSMLIWRDNGPWHKTVVTRHESQHDFPKAHKDVLAQTIYYKVPTDYYDDLARFDGSVTVDRTMGTLSARCDKEENNILALNVANDIIKGKRTANDARTFFAQTAAGMARGEKSEYALSLMFRPDAKGGDADKPATATNTKMTPKDKKGEKEDMKDMKDKSQKSEQKKGSGN